MPPFLSLPSYNRFNFVKTDCIPKRKKRRKEERKRGREGKRSKICIV
jgi:hypothetical protein